MIRSASARTARRISRSSSSPSLRAIPNLNVFRPCRRGRDGGMLGTGAAARARRPRRWRCRGRACPRCARRADDEPLRARRLCPQRGRRRARSDAARDRLGSLARGRRRRRRLRAEGKQVAVVSMPCWELFEEQSEAYRARCSGPRRASAIEAAAAIRLGPLDRRERRFIGMPGFGASAPRRRGLQAFSESRPTRSSRAAAKLSP